MHEQHHHRVHELHIPEEHHHCLHEEHPHHEHSLSQTGALPSCDPVDRAMPPGAVQKLQLCAVWQEVLQMLKSPARCQLFVKPTPVGWPSLAISARLSALSLECAPLPPMQSSADSPQPTYPGDTTVMGCRWEAPWCPVLFARAPLLLVDVENIEP